MVTRQLSRKTNKRQDSADFEIHTIASFLNATENGHSLAVYNDMHSIIWIAQGSGELSIDLEIFSLNADTVYCVKPGQALQLKICELAKGYIIFFKREFIELYEKRTFELINTVLFNQSLNPPVIKINKHQRGFMNRMVDEMIQESRNSLDLRAELLKGLLKVFVIYLCRQFTNSCSKKMPSRTRDLTNTFYAHLENHFSTKKLVRDYAKLLGITSNHLNTAVKTISGFAASHHIKQRIVLEAKRRAVFEGYSMKEIAYYLGFLDPSHFSKYFKNSSGVKFSDFKRETTGYS